MLSALSHTIYTYVNLKKYYKNLHTGITLFKVDTYILYIINIFIFIYSAKNFQLEKALTEIEG